MIFETHAHYNDKKFDADREAILLDLPKQGISPVINVGDSIGSTTEVLTLAAKYPYIYAALGVHPSEISDLNEESFAWLAQQTKQEKVVAIGEIGLDYYWDTPDRSIQKHWFEEQLEMAREADLPLVIHSREAAQDTMQIMQKHRAQEIGGVIHCYSYSLELAREFVKMGFFIGIGGVVTFKNARKLKEVAAGIPIEHIVLETDSPYLAPVPFRGKRNSSLYLPYIAEAVAQIKGIETEEVIARTEENAERLYRIG